MVVITDDAEEQIYALARPYDRLDRDLATIRMAEAIRNAMTLIEAQTGPFFAAPRPYPYLDRLGWRWLKSGRYWIGFSATPAGYAINGVFHESADIPGRL